MATQQLTKARPLSSTGSSEIDRSIAALAGGACGPDPFAAAVHATRMPMVITDPRLPDNPIVFANASFCALTGYARDEIVGRNCRFLQGPETDRATVAAIRAAIEAGEVIETELRNHRKDGTPFWNRLLVSPVRSDAGEVIYFFASQYDVTLERERLVRLQHDRDALETEVAQRTSELTESDARLRFALKAGRLGAWTLDVKTRTLVASGDCKRNFGRAPGAPFGYDELVASIHPDDRDRMQAAVAASLDGDQEYEIEYRVMTPDGDLRWVQIRGQPFYDADGAPASMAGISMDVTERKRIEEQRALLAAELSHRVKNTLATVAAIVQQTVRNAENVEAIGSTIGARIASLSTAHDLLVRDSWDGAAIAEIVGEALAPFHAGDGRIMVEGPDLRLPPPMALALAMALHELATNAAKYGALSNEAGRIRVDWELTATTPPRLRLRWAEDGGPPVAAPMRRGFGSRVIERALAQAMNGTARVDYRAEGIRFTLDAPVPDGGDERATR